jgi:heat shock protein HslJ
VTRFSARAAIGLATVIPLVLAVGCASQPPAPTERGAAAASASPTTLVGTSWRLEDLGGVSALAGVEATLEFPEAGKVSGKASCNRFFGTVEVTGQSIKFGPLAATKMACIDDAANAQEKKYLEALQGAERFELDGPALRIYSAGIEQPLRFVRK